MTRKLEFIEIKLPSISLINQKFTREKKGVTDV